MTKFIFSGYDIQETNSFFVFDSLDPNNTERIKINIFEGPFTLIRENERFCIGRYNLTDFKSFACPHQKKLPYDNKNNTCVECFKYNSFNPSFYNVKVSDLSLKQRDYNLSPHNVYLVFFSDVNIKVGISHHKRTLTRWLEQGARIATIIYTFDNAYDAREIEERISKGLKLPESFRTNQKRQLLSEAIHFDNGVKSMENIKLQIERIIDSPIINTDYINLDKYYLRDTEINKNIIDVSNESSLFASGVVIGLIGDTLIFENANKQFMISLKKFISHEVSFENILSKQNFTPAQISLF